MTLIEKLRPTARRCAVVALSSAVLLGSAAAAGTAPVAGSDSATQVADKKIKTKVAGRKIT